MSELHIAVTLDQPEVVRSILEQNLCSIHEIDKNGDQPAHIAARLNHVGCIKILIEYDVRMGRKNYCGL
jgi:ankyrin repeat protein